MSRKGKGLQVHSDGLAGMGTRFVDAWHRAERGEAVNEAHVTFVDLETLLLVLTPRRLEMLRHLHAHEAASVRHLSAALERDYKRVHGDVAALEAVGLIVRDGTRLSAPWAQVQATFELAA
jgi:predicted transcriptional regulator